MATGLLKFANQRDGGARGQFHWGRADVDGLPFRGKNVPAGQKSLAYAFTYRHAERTLTDGEVNAAHDRLVAQFKQSLQATVRES